MEFNGWTPSGGGGGGGDVVGPGSSTDNAIARYDGITGKLIQDSLVTINDTGQIVATNGTQASPAYVFTGDPNTGLYQASVGEIGIASSGVGVIGLWNNLGLSIGNGFLVHDSRFTVHSNGASTVPIVTEKNNVGQAQTYLGTGSPNSVVTGTFADRDLDISTGDVYTKRTTTSNTGWSLLSFTDVQGPKYVVGNSLAGDTAANCNFLDTGNGAGIAAAITAANATAGDIHIRPGTYEFGQAGSPALPLVVGANISISGAGRTTVLKGPASGATKRLWTLAEGYAHSNYIIDWPQATTGGGNPEVINATGAGSFVNIRMLMRVQTGTSSLLYGYRLTSSVAATVLVQMVNCSVITTGTHVNSSQVFTTGQSVTNTLALMMSSCELNTVTGTCITLGSAINVSSLVMTGCVVSPGAGAGEDAILANTSPYVAVSGCKFVGVSSSEFLDLTAVKSAFVTSCDFTTGAYGIIVRNSVTAATDELQVTNCIFTDVGQPFYTNGSVGTSTITGCKVINATNNAILSVSGQTGLVVQGCTIDCSVNAGAIRCDSPNAVIANNRIVHTSTGSSTGAIFVNGVRANITGNRITYAGNHGVYLDSLGNQCTVTGNIVEYSGTASSSLGAIATNTSDSHSITGNSVNINGAAVDRTAYEIRAGSTGCVLTGNVAYVPNGGTTNPVYAIKGDNTIVVTNNARTPGTNGFSDTGTSNELAHNLVTP